MGNNSGGDLFVVVLGLVVLLFNLLFLPFTIAFHRSWQKRRRKEMINQSKKLGLQLTLEDDHDLIRTFKFLDVMNKEVLDLYALNVMRGDYNGRPVIECDIHYREEDVWWWAPSWEKHCYYSLIILKIESVFPELLINPKTSKIFSWLTDAFDEGDIDFESHEFSERFDVRCRDKKFAYEFCNSQMMDYLLKQPLVPWELERDSLAIATDVEVSVSKIEWYLKYLANIRSLMPNYLFTR